MTSRADRRPSKAVQFVSGLGSGGLRVKVRAGVGELRARVRAGVRPSTEVLASIRHAPQLFIEVVGAAKGLPLKGCFPQRKAKGVAPVLQLQPSGWPTKTRLVSKDGARIRFGSWGSWVGVQLELLAR